VSGKPRILIAEDHTILREGLRAMLSSNADFDVVGEAEDGREAVRFVESLAPDLVLLDLSLPRMSGINAIREIKKRHPETKVIALTVHKTEEYVLEALRAGADGYILKDATLNELLMGIKSVLKGRAYLSPGVSDKVIKGYLAGKKTARIGTPWDTLTRREKEILKLIAEGYRNKEIAGYLYISVKTVEKHRANLMKKLNLHGISELTALAIEKGLVTK